MKYLILSFVFLSVALLVTASPPPGREHGPRTKWTAFKNRQRKNFTSNKEEAARLTNFLNTEAMILEHNSNPDATYDMEHNRFSDLPEEEKAALTGVIPPPFLDEVRSFEIFDELDRQLPATYDLRTAKPGCVGAVKKQGRCGSCWAFAAIASLQCAYFFNRSSIQVLSEQQLVSCDVDYGDFGCNGGFYTNAWKYLKIAAGGSFKSIDYPYTSTGGGNPACIKPLNKITAKVTNYNIPISSSVNSIKNALLKYGTLSVAITVVNSFYNYRTGVYTDASCTAQRINHAVNIIGWGTNYWIVRNSWGSSWGNGGYIFIKLGVNMCNIEKYVYAVTAN